MTRSPPTLALLVLVSLLLGSAPALAEDPVSPEAARTLGVPGSDEVVLDGRAAEDAWEAALLLDVEPLAQAGPGAEATTPRVRAVLCGDELVLAVEVEEPPGPGMGLVLMVAPEDAESAADALAVAYAPQDVRAPLYTVRGPRGVGRSTYRVRGAADVRQESVWSLELALCVADLELPEPSTPIRLALAVRGRTPTLLAWSPEGAAFAGPATWHRLAPPASGWPVRADAARHEALRLANEAEDERDGLRLDSWARFRVANVLPWTALLVAAGNEKGALDSSREEILEAMRQTLLAPLEAVSTHRPELAYAHVVRGRVLRLLGLEDEAHAAFVRAAELCPGLPEARFGFFVEELPAELAGTALGAATHYESLFAWVGTEVVDGAPYLADGRDLALGIVLYRHGDFAEASKLLDPLVERYSFSRVVVYAAGYARQGATDWMRELRYRTEEEKADDLPRVRFRTTKGTVLVELLENDAPNTVKHLVWLVQHGVYDDATVATVPYFATRVEAGGGDLPYALPTELPRVTDSWRPGARRDLRRRRPWRGMLTMLSDVKDAGTAAFAFLTGTSLHLESEYVAFGRVLEGLDVVDSLTNEDRILGADVVRLRPGTEYRPISVEGTPAPAPR